MNNTPIHDDFHTKSKHINMLFEFIKNNKEEQFLDYLSILSPDDVDINMRDANGNYLITFAVIINNVRILKKIYEYGARIDIIDTEGYNILYYPIKFNYVEIIDMLITLNKNTIGMSIVNIKDKWNSVPLFYAIKNKNMYALHILLTNGSDANYKNNDNINALHIAVLKKDIMMVKMLLKYILFNINIMTNILITGGLGYIGSHTIVEIYKTYQKYKIIVIDNLSNSSVDIIPNIEKLIYPNEIIFYKGDLLNNELLIDIFNNHHIEVVIHFASLKSVSQSVSDPLLYYSNNIGGTLILLNVMDKFNVRKLIFSSSATVYGCQQAPFTEDSQTGITIHEVDENYDEGKILFQAVCEIDISDTPKVIAEKVQRLEHLYYPRVIEDWINQ